MKIRFCFVGAAAIFLCGSFFVRAQTTQPATPSSITPKELEIRWRTETDFKWGDFRFQKGEFPPHKGKSITPEKLSVFYQEKLIRTFGAPNPEGLPPSYDFAIEYLDRSERPKLLVRTMYPKVECLDIYSMTPKLDPLFDSCEYSARFDGFSYLDPDGVPELVLLLSTFDYFYGLSHADSPLLSIIFKYDATQNSYFPANPLFKTNVDAKIADEKQLLTAQIQSGSFHTGIQEIQNGKKVTRPTQTGLRSFLKVMLTQVYSGREKEAWEFFNQTYTFGDKERLRQEIQAKLKECKIYRELKRRFP